MEMDKFRTSSHTLFALPAERTDTDQEDWLRPVQRTFPSQRNPCSHAH